jgi:hypothetical protein
LWLTLALLTVAETVAYIVLTALAFLEPSPAQGLSSPMLMKILIRACLTAALT